MSPGAQRGLGRATWVVAAALSLLACAYTLTVSSGRHKGNAAVRGDAHYIYVAARSVAEDLDLDLTNQYRVMSDRWGLGRDVADDGTRLPVREVGPSLLMVPGLWLHRALRLGPEWQASFAVLLAAAAIGLTFAGTAAALEALRARGLLALSRARRDGLALAATLGFVVPFYTIGTAGYAHAPDAAACAWLLALICRGARPFACGLALAAALLMRLQNGLWVLVPALAWLLGPRPRPPPLRGALITLALGALGLAQQAYAALAHPGSKRGAIRWGLDFFDLDHLGRDLRQVLVGVHGLWTWTPIALLATVGLAMGATRRDTRPLALALLALLAALTFLFACALDPDGGHAFGARRHAGMSAVLALGLAFLAVQLRALPRGRLWTRAADLLLVGLVGYNLYLSELAATGALGLSPR